jgi:hypothetical protein
LPARSKAFALDGLRELALVVYYWHAQQNKSPPPKANAYNELVAKWHVSGNP